MCVPDTIIKHANIKRSKLIRDNIVLCSIFTYMSDSILGHPTVILYNTGNSIHIYIAELIRREVFYIWSHVSTTVQETDSVFERI